MPDHDTRRRPCTDDRHLPPGASIFRGVLLGLASAALALVVWALGGGLLWALLIWLFAGPACLVAWSIREVGATADPSFDRDDRTRAFPVRPPSCNGVENV